MPDTTLGAQPELPEDLQALRQRLDQVDTGIVDLIAERQSIVAAIGNLKEHSGAPLRHYEREREVIERGMARAQELGVSERLAREVLEILIRYSLGKQEHDKWVRSGHGQGHQALVIGGAGRMGHWMARYLDTLGYQVHIADPQPGASPFECVPDWESVVGNYELVVVAVPLRPSNEILLRIARLQPPGLVFDIGSLKSPMRQGLEAVLAAGCRICSVHPMFGPDEYGLSGRHILFVNLGHAAAVREARALFAHTAADCVELTLEQHDEVMAWVLGLSHLLNIAFAASLVESGATAHLLRRISSSTFNAQLQVASRVVAENPHLYYEIQQGNSRTPEVTATFRKVLDRLSTAVAAQDEDTFTRSMLAAHAHLSEGLPANGNGARTT